MFRKNRVCVATGVTITLALSTFAQADDSKNVIVIQQSVEVKANRATADGIVQFIGDTIAVEQNTKIDLNDQLKKVLRDLSIDIGKHRSYLQSRFELLKLNEDDLIDLEEYSFGGHYRRDREDFWGWVKTFATMNDGIDDKPDVTLSYISSGGVTCHSGREAVSASSFLEKQREVEFDVADANRDGQLSRDEFLEGEQRMIEREQRYEFANLDSNQDQYIDLDEYMIQLDGIYELDSNQDRYVTYDELRTEMSTL